MLLQRLMTVSIAVRKHGSIHPASTEKAISDPDPAIFQPLHRAHGRICQQPVSSFQKVVIKRDPSHADVQIQEAFVQGRKPQIGRSLKRQSPAIL
ncbi:hypothetical protein O162_11850 [Pseudomonas putida SJ3]|nr:hypothetical protein O162_11850 [Pseudomonas putida SJ3]